MIVEEINNRFCQTVWHQYPHYRKKIGSMAIIADGYVKMAHLALVGCHSINGVAKLHTEILKHREMKNFYGIFPKNLTIRPTASLIAAGF